MMGDIYAHRLLNISATASKNGEGGLFNQRHNLITSPLLSETVEFPRKPDLIGNARQESHYIASGHRLFGRLPSRVLHWERGYG